jgi:hypothetical protein
MENVLRLLYADNIKCNVIVITHINYLNESFQDNEGIRTRVVGSNATDAFGSIRAYPTTIGRALDPKVGRYFNNVVEMRIEGSGRSARRMIYTIPQGAVNVKTSAPFSLKSSYDASTGLAEIFAVLRNQPPPTELMNALNKPKLTPTIKTT